MIPRFCSRPASGLRLWWSLVLLRCPVSTKGKVAPCCGMPAVRPCRSTRREPGLALPLLGERWGTCSGLTGESWGQGSAVLTDPRWRVPALCSLRELLSHAPVCSVSIPQLFSPRSSVSVPQLFSPRSSVGIPQLFSPRSSVSVPQLFSPRSTTGTDPN